MTLSMEVEPLVLTVPVIWVTVSLAGVLSSTAGAVVSGAVVSVEPPEQPANRLTHMAAESSIASVFFITISFSNPFGIQG